MRKFVLLASIGFIFTVSSQSGFGQSINNRFAISRSQLSSEISSHSTGHAALQSEEAFEALSPMVAVPNSTYIGIQTKYHLQTNHGGLHNIQVDPDHPNQIHAVIMSVPNVTVSDTIAAAYPNRNCFYIYSADGGTTWTTPKAVSTIRAGFPAMILYKRNGVWVPIIGMHRYVSNTSQNFIAGLYIEKGAPGDGNFSETLASRTAADGTPNLDIIWPSIAISPDNGVVYMACEVSRKLTSDPWHTVQFGAFKLDGAGNATFSGWREGPGPLTANGEGASTNGDGVVRVAPSGKVGLTWINSNFSGSVPGVYYNETTDTGKTWTGDLSPAFSPLDSGSVAQSTSNPTYLTPSAGLDMFFVGETPQVVFAAYERELKDAGSYIPQSGTLMFWKPGSTPTLLISKNRPGAIDTGAFLSPWVNTLHVDPQGESNLIYPTIGLSPNANNWSIYFQAWANSDTELVNDTLHYGYGSIYRINTATGGSSWGQAEPIASNSLHPGEQKFDYRFPMVSMFNPIKSGLVSYNLLYGVDTSAGYFGLSSAGYPGWDDMGYYYHTDALNAVKSGQAISFDLSQNYPNPFNPSTTISFNLKASANVLVEVRDMMGRLVGTVVSGKLAAGPHSYIFNASGLTSGIYYYSLNANGQSYSRTMTLLK